MSIGLMRMDGFDTWIVGGANNDMSNSFLQGHMGWQNSGSGPFPTFVAGRYTTITGSQALFMNANTIDDRRMRTMTRVSVTAGVTDLLDTQSFYFGMNVNLGAATSGASGYHRVFTFCTGDPGGASGAGSHRLTIMFQATTGGAGQGFELVKGSLASPIASILATGLPTRNPWQQWAYIECGLYRSALSGTFDLYVENAAGTLDHVIAYAGDTSVATVGNINAMALGSSKTTGGNCGHYFDDFWCASGGRVGQPSYVLALKPASDNAGTGVSGWSALSGTAHWSLVNDIPVTSGSHAKYVYNTTSSGTFPILDLYTQTALPYNPAHVYGIEALVLTVKSGIVGTGGVPTFYANIRKGSTDYASSDITASTTTGVIDNLAFNAIKVLELDPDTASEWNPSTANGVLFGPGSNAISGGAQIQVYSATMYVLASIATGSAVSSGSPIAGYGQPFHMIQTG